MRRVGDDAMQTRSTRLERSRLEELLELMLEEATAIHPYIGLSRHYPRGGICRWCRGVKRADPTATMTGGEVPPTTKECVVQHAAVPDRLTGTHECCIHCKGVWARLIRRHMTDSVVKTMGAAVEECRPKGMTRS